MEFDDRGINPDPPLSDNKDHNVLSLKVSGLIWDIKQYAIHDGPGVRTTVFLKGCPLTCRWCCNPESQTREPELLWIFERCVGCGTCLDLCPKHALSTTDNGKKTIDRVKCDLCALCVENCPGNAFNIMGQRLTVDEVLAEVAKDALYYQRSGGGLTLSGGDPLYQPVFATALLRQYKQEEKGLHTAVETCGWAHRRAIEKMAEYTDLFLYDIKHMEPSEHLRFTGQSNRLILENARFLAENGHCLVIRIPLIPGYNDQRENLVATAEFSLSLPGVKRIDILPYHRLGEPKYHRLGRLYSLTGKPTLGPDRIKWAKTVLEKIGVDVRVGG